MTTYEYCQVSTTTDASEKAEALARSAVEARVAACGQVIGPITSVYRWQGAVETAQEWLVLFKTTAEGVEPLVAHVRAEHSYDVPEIICTPIVAGNPDYLEWLTAETS